MALNLARMHSFIDKEIRAGRPLAESMERVIRKCEKSLPHDDWAELLNIPLDDSKRLTKIARNWFRNRKLKAVINGLWFGIYNPANGRWPIADFHVCGAASFIDSRDNNSWASDITWAPDDRAYSPVLEAIYKIAYRDNGLSNNAEYPLCLAYTALAVRDLLTELNPSLFLRNSDSVGVAVGFDSGDFIILGTLTESGLQMSV